MPRKRDPNRDKAFNIFKEHDGNIQNREIAKILDVSEKTVGGWKSKDKWSEKLNGVLHSKIRSTPFKKTEQKARAPDEEITLDNFLEEAELTDKQRIFCLYYVRSFNATQAAINAGYSVATAHVQGPRLLGNVRVRQEIKRVKTAITNDLFLEAADVLNKYIKIAFSDMTDYLTFGQKNQPVMGMAGPLKDKNGRQIYEEVNFVDFKDSSYVDGTIISEVKQGKDGVSIKLEDRMKALDKLSLYFDLFPDKFKRQIEEEKVKLARDKAKKPDDEKPVEIIIKRKQRVKDDD
ncbi:terminase small subunit [Peribacillus sp. B-H-3]|uniref:terminase small subunit n=1 Tax=Peribacillus sp. B-H-3 TaxID=3400420 RepID=UPI003B0211D1